MPNRNDEIENTEEVSQQNSENAFTEESAENSSEESGSVSTDDGLSESNDELFENREKPERKVGFLVGLFNYIENFSFSSFKESNQEKREESQEKKKKKKELKDSTTTISDVQKQRKNRIKYVGYKIGLIGLFFIFVTVAIIMAFQDNEKIARPNYNMKKVLNDTTSFGGIDQKDYFLEQNVLDDKINIVEKEAKKGRNQIRKQLVEQTDKITKHIDVKLAELDKSQKKYVSEVTQDSTKSIEEKLKESEKEKKAMQDKLEKLARKIERVEKRKPIVNNTGFNLKNGKIVIPDFGKTSSTQNGTKQGTPVVLSNSDENDSNAEVEYVQEEVNMMNVVVPELTFDTGLEEKEDKKENKGFEFDLTTTLVRVTLISGIKAPALTQGMKNPTSVLMSIDGIAYAANDNKRIDFKGCLLQGVAVGNINTSRAEVFGTHLSCIIEGDSGIKYKIEHVFPENEVWIKGEDGSDGIAGLIVDSSGKVMAKSAAIGFMQGLTNYFSAQNLVTGGLATANNTNQSTVAQLGTSMQSGAGQGLSSGFDLIIKKYEEILEGYYPFIDVKGGRKNLTAVFGGGVTLKAVPYKDIELENY